MMSASVGVSLETTSPFIISHFRRSPVPATIAHGCGEVVYSCLVVGVPRGHQAPCLSAHKQSRRWRRYCPKFISGPSRGVTAPATRSSSRYTSASVMMTTSCGILGRSGAMP